LLHFNSAFSQCSTSIYQAFREQTEKNLMHVKTHFTVIGLKIKQLAEDRPFWQKIAMAGGFG